MQPVEYSITVAYREPDPDISSCLHPTEREAKGKLKVAIVNAAAHRMAVEAAETQRGAPALDNGGLASVKIRLSAQDAFGNDLCGRSPVDVPEVRCRASLPACAVTLMLLADLCGPCTTHTCVGRGLCAI